MKPEGSLPAGYFDAVYDASDDPWSFQTSDYEAEKYRQTLDALDGRWFERAFEIGCSIGVFTALLASRCARLLAVDVSEAALEQARRRCAGLGHVRFERLAVPDTFPPGFFDLVTTCEVAYYWSRADLAKCAALIEGSLAPGGVWLLVHWTPEVADYPLGGDEVHELILTRSREPGASLRHVIGSRHDLYRLDLFEKQAPGGPGR
ncbi:MAG: class I SAM-dependent methyltransferase [Caldimonas sp.]